MYWDSRLKCYLPGAPPRVEDDVIAEAYNDVRCHQVIPESKPRKSFGAGTLHHRLYWPEQTSRWTQPDRAMQYRAAVGQAQGDQVGRRDNVPADREREGWWSVRYINAGGTVTVDHFRSEKGAKELWDGLTEETRLRLWWHHRLDRHNI